MTKSNTPALKLTNVSKTYKNGFQAVKGIDLEVAKGDFFALLGPNGAGKSTTIGMISDLVNMSTGKIEINGVDLRTKPSAAKSFLGVVPQEVNINIFEKPWDILLQQAGYYGVPKKVAKVRAEKYLRKMHLWDKAFESAMNMSGGMKRRLMIARGLIHHPKVLLLDEPTAGVDVEIRHDMWKFLSEVREETGLTIILTTHYLEEAENLCNKIAIINHGKIVANTSMKELLTELETEAIILYLDQAPKKPITLKGFTMRQVDELSIEVDVKKDQQLSQVFKQLCAQEVPVKSMRNKVNRLEQLFVDLVRSNNEESQS